jgi:hypothetical protein
VDGLCLNKRRIRFEVARISTEIRATLLRNNHTDEVGGLFIHRLHKERNVFRKIPPTKVGGSFIPCLHKERNVFREIPPTKLVDCSYIAYTKRETDSEKSHQRSWWIVHTSPTQSAKRIPRNPTNEVGGLFIPRLRKARNRFREIPPTKSWWIVHTSPTQSTKQIPRNPTNEVGWIVHTSPTQSAKRIPRNPTNFQLVDCSYLAYAKHETDSEKSHQRSWWIVHTSPTQSTKQIPRNPTNEEVGGLFIPRLHNARNRFREIPPTKLVDCSYFAYKAAAEPRANPTNPSWWIVHTESTKVAAGRLPSPLFSEKPSTAPSAARRSSQHMPRVATTDRSSHLPGRQESSFP